MSAPRELRREADSPILGEEGSWSLLVKRTRRKMTLRATMRTRRATDEEHTCHPRLLDISSSDV